MWMLLRAPGKEGISLVATASKVSSSNTLLKLEYAILFDIVNAILDSVENLEAIDLVIFNSDNVPQHLHS